MSVGASAGSARHALFVAGGVIVAALVMLGAVAAHKHAAAEPVLSREPFGKASSGAFSSIVSSAAAPAPANALPSARATLAVRMFGVPPELVPKFFEGSRVFLSEAPRPKTADSLEALTARVDADHARCEGGSTEACVQEVTDCAANRPYPARGNMPSESPAQRALLMQLQSPNGPALRAALANGTSNLPPSYVAAAQSLGIGHERERLAAARALSQKCSDAHARSVLPEACNAGSLAACELVLRDPSQKAMLPRACDVGSAPACADLARSLGETTLPGEAARLRALELEHCAAPGAVCSAHSRDELADTAQNTLRAGINRMCVERGVTECARLAQEFERDRSDESLTAEVRNSACTLGDASSCGDMMLRYADGRGVPRDEQKALALYERSHAEDTKNMQEAASRPCNGGPCELLQLMVRRSAATAEMQDQIMRAQLAPTSTAQRCDSGELNACIGLMNAFHAGRHTDEARAAVFRRKAATLLDAQCQSDKDALACDELPGILVALDGADRARGLSLWDKACNARHLEACSALVETSTDPAQRASAHQREVAIQCARCDAGSLEDCSAAAGAYEYGILGVARDPEKQRSYAAKRDKLLDTASTARP